jgi:HK97 family phage major capsid protein
MKNVAELQAEIESLSNRAAAIAQLAMTEKRELSADETAEIDRIQGAGDSQGEIGKLKEQKERAQKLEKLTAEMAINKVTNSPHGSEKSKIRVVPIAGKLKSFSGPTAEHDAWVTGHFFNATMNKSEKSKEWLHSHGVNIQNVHSTGDNTKGGYLVPQETAATMIRLVEEYGKFRQAMRMVWPIAHGSLQVPKRAGGFTVYHPGENQSITQSDTTLSMVELTPRKAAILTAIPNELSEDALPILADFLTNEMAYAFAVDEDNAGFLGDGTNAYNGVVGLANALAAGSFVTATSQTSLGALTLASFNSVVGAVKEYPGMQPAWYMSKPAYFASAARLKDAGGGNNNADLASGSGQSFLGYPVVFTQNLPGLTATTGSKVAYFGDLSLACAMGDSRTFNIQSDSSVFFASDQIAIRATSRYDIQVHDRGTTSTSGAVVGLILG